LGKFHELKITNKLGVVTCTFVLSVTFAIWSLISEQQIAIQFAAQRVADVCDLDGLIVVQAGAASQSLSGLRDGTNLADRVTELHAHANA
jgi:hypothetical protein